MVSTIFFLAIDELLHLHCFLHRAIEPIDAGDIGAKIEAQRGIDAQKSRDRDACSLSISSECCCDGLPFGTMSIFAPGTAASMRALICSNDSI